MEIIVIVYFFSYYSCSCSFKSARFVLIVQSMLFGTAFTDCNSICQIEDGGHACGAMTYHDVIRSLRHVNNPHTGCVFLGESKNGFRGDEWSLRAFASMPSNAIFLRARAEIKNLLSELASNCKNLGSTSKRALV